MVSTLKNENFLADSKPSPKIYVACLAAYNAGELFGNWIEVNQPAEDVLEQIRELLADSPIPQAEEFAIHDYEGFYSLKIDEYESIEEVCKIAQFISKHGKLGAALATYFGSLEDAETALEENYRGEYESKLDYATQLFDELYLHRVPELVSYIDYQSFAKDLFIDDCFSIELQGRCHVFERH